MGYNEKEDRVEHKGEGMDKEQLVQQEVALLDIERGEFSWCAS